LPTGLLVTNVSNRWAATSAEMPGAVVLHGDLDRVADALGVDAHPRLLGARFVHRLGGGACEDQRAEEQRGAARLASGRISHRVIVQPLHHAVLARRSVLKIHATGRRGVAFR
jgi:hypothetical protein